MGSNCFIAKLARWTIILHGYNFDVVHKAKGLIMMLMDQIETQVASEKDIIKAC